jgi:hypothetical protein
MRIPDHYRLTIAEAIVFVALIAFFSAYLVLLGSYQHGR